MITGCIRPIAAEMAADHQRKASDSKKRLKPPIPTSQLRLISMKCAKVTAKRYQLGGLEIPPAQPAIVRMIGSKGPQPQVAYQPFSTQGLTSQETTPTDHFI